MKCSEVIWSTIFLGQKLVFIFKHVSATFLSQLNIDYLICWFFFCVFLFSERSQVGLHFFKPCLKYLREICKINIIEGPLFYSLH